jgi:para-aminobenzoate synthetase/4-amino-4-deoxychorismate lyase
MPIECEIDFPELATLTPAERLRRGFVAPLAVHVARKVDEVRAVLAAAESAARRGRWCVGFVSHEAAPAFDPAFVVHARGPAPLAWFAEFAAPAALPCEPWQGGGFRLAAWRSDTDYAHYARAIESIRADIREGRFYQVNFTARLRAAFEGDSGAFFRAMQREQPHGFHARIDTGEGVLLSLSPELFFDLRDGHVVTQPMKGTAPRGDTPEEDERIAWNLAHSDKERAENLMIVDLLRNDLARIARPGSVEVAALFALQALPSVWQMTSTITAGLRPDVGLADTFGALFPCGSVTGAPKVEALRAIRQLEAHARGAYCGAVGYVAPGAGGGVNACFNVGIRTLWIRDGVAECGVGGGITFDSTVDGEWAELHYKARFATRAARSFELLETLRLDDGGFALLERHLARLQRSARHFRFALAPDLVQARLRELARTHARGLWRVRLWVARDGALRVEAEPLAAPPARRTVRLAAEAVVSADEFLRHKTTRREVYEAHAPAGQPEFDTLLINERGELTEFTRANVALTLDGVRCTPPLSCGLLDGTLRAEMLEKGDLVERILRVDDLPRASRIEWINSVRGSLDVCMEAPAGAGSACAGPCAGAVA